GSFINFLGCDLCGLASLVDLGGYENGDGKFTARKIRCLCRWFFFWGVQVHDLPPRLFSKAVARQLENFAGLFKEYNAKQVSGGYTSYLRMRVRIDIRTPLKCRKKIQSSYGNSMDSFYLIRLTREVNESDMEWHLSLWAVGRRATVVESV
ncbi:hypothetical protein Gorai_013284, partial [Gossypium raimondii]|nr:hypothetical protein [Gossypium raimondii]